MKKIRMKFGVPKWEKIRIAPCLMNTVYYDATPLICRHPRS